MIASLKQHLLHVATLARDFVLLATRLGRLPAWLIALVVLAGLNSDSSAAGQESPQRRPDRNSGDTRVFKDRVTPNWFGGNTRFWYRNALPGGAKEFILVDAERGVREPAFDHAKLAAALAKAAGADFSADKLPFDIIEFIEEAKAVRFVARTDDQVRPEQLLDPAHVGSDLVRRAVCHQLLRVDAAQESQASAEVPGQSLGFHVPRSRLKRMKTVHARVNHPGDQPVH